MAKPQSYPPGTRDVALAILQACHGDFRKAARTSLVDEKRLRFWAGGGEEDQLPESLLEANGPVLSYQAQVDTTQRPLPPEHLIDDNRDPVFFTPAHDVEQWVRANFLSPDGPLYDDEWWFLEDCPIGFVWTNFEMRRGGNQVAGLAEIPAQKKDWVSQRALQLLRNWFGDVPVFIITLDAPICATLSDRTFCSLVDHELRHCEIRTNGDGEPMFDPFGRPMAKMQGHHVEEFVNTVGRYGSDAGAGRTKSFVEAAGMRPIVSDAQIYEACGDAWEEFTGRSYPDLGTSF